MVPGTWTQISGTLVIPSTYTPNEVANFFEGTDKAYDVCIGDVSVTPL